MRWLDNIMDKIKTTMNERRSRVTVKTADPIMLTINSTMDFETNAAKNRLWYQGYAEELDQFYAQMLSPCWCRTVSMSIVR